MFVRRKQVRSGNRILTYLQVVENHRRDGKVRQKVLLTVGREDQMPPGRVDEFVRVLGAYAEKALVLDSVQDISLVAARAFGGVYVLGRLWDELDLDGIIGRRLAGRSYSTDMVAAIRTMVLNRCLDPRSKLGTLEWAKHRAWCPEAQSLGSQNLYRALDFLVEHKEAVEKALYSRMTDLLCLDSTLVFYDTTLVDVHSEPAPDDQERQLVRYSRNGSAQFLLALALSRDGLPFAHEVMPGNTTDVTTVKEAVGRLKQRFEIRQCVFVGDRGMVSDENLRWLQSQEVHYIVGAPMRRSKEVRDGVLATAGRYQEVSESLHLKEVGADGVRYIICYNPREAGHDRTTRESIVGHLEEVLRHPPGPGTKEAAALYSHPAHGRYLRRLQDGSLRLDRGRVSEDERYDGKYVLRTSHPKLAKEEVAAAYRQLMTVERSFRSLKSLEELAPVYHWKDRRVRGHVFVCVLAHLLERILERRLAQGGLQDCTAARALEVLDRVHMVPIEVKGRRYLARTEPDADVGRVLEALRYRLPPRLQELDGPGGAKVAEPHLLFSC